MKLANREVGGTREEKFSYQYLPKTTFELILHNFSTRVGKIDLRIKGGEVLVFTKIQAKRTKIVAQRRKCLLKTNLVGFAYGDVIFTS